MNRDFTRMWHQVRDEYPLEWAAWLGCPNWYDGGLCVNRSPEEHYMSRIYYGRVNFTKKI